MRKGKNGLGQEGTRGKGRKGKKEGEEGTRFPMMGKGRNLLVPVKSLASQAATGVFIVVTFQLQFVADIL